MKVFAKINTDFSSYKKGDELELVLKTGLDKFINLNSKDELLVKLPDEDDTEAIYVFKKWLYDYRFVI